MNLLTIVAIFFTLVGCVFFILLIKKMYYRFYLRKRFFIIPRVGSQGISNIGMVLALSIAIILFLIIVTANFASVVFRLWVGTRVMVEGILIKIGGLLFGPIIGMCLGMAVDLLTVAYSGGVFHVGYLMSAMLFGLIGGFVRMLIIYTHENALRFSLLSTIVSAIMIVGSIFPILLDVQSIYYISFFGLDIRMTKDLMIQLLLLLPGVGLLALWTCYFIQRWQNYRNKNAKQWYLSFAPVFITILLSEIIINIIIMPFFDASVSTLSYQTWFAIRLLLFGFMIFGNIVIILPVYSIVNPILKYHYEDELVENIDEPLYIE